jgi:hypothetical protein
MGVGSLVSAGTGERGCGRRWWSVGLCFLGHNGIVFKIKKLVINRYLLCPGDKEG